MRPRSLPPLYLSLGPLRRVEHRLVATSRVDADNPSVQIIRRGKHKSLTGHEKPLLKRRQAIEPLICQTQSDHRMDRYWLQGAMGDVLHALRRSGRR